MLVDLKARLKNKLPSPLYDKDTDELTPLADTILISIMAVVLSLALSTFLPVPIAMFIVYSVFIYLAAVLNQRYRIAERARKKKKDIWADD